MEGREALLRRFVCETAREMLGSEVICEPYGTKGVDKLLFVAALLASAGSGKRMSVVKFGLRAEGIMNRVKEVLAEADL